MKVGADLVACHMPATFGRTLSDLLQATVHCLVALPFSTALTTSHTPPRTFGPSTPRRVRSRSALEAHILEAAGLGQGAARFLPSDLHQPRLVDHRQESKREPSKRPANGSEEQENHGPMTEKPQGTMGKWENLRSNFLQQSSLNQQTSTLQQFLQALQRTFQDPRIWAHIKSAKKLFAARSLLIHPGDSGLPGNSAWIFTTRIDWESLTTWSPSFSADIC